MFFWYDLIPLSLQVNTHTHIRVFIVHIKYVVQSIVSKRGLSEFYTLPYFIFAVIQNLFIVQKDLYI